MNDLQKTEQNTVHNSLSMIERVAMSPDVTMEKLEQLMQMQERIEERNARKAYDSAIADMQAELPRVAENGKSHNNKYALLEDINDAVRPTLQRHGFAIKFDLEQPEGVVIVRATLSHREGHREDACVTLPLDTSGSKSAVQSVGSTISYGKRYTICALLNISTGDDIDGNDNGLAEAIIDISKATDLKSLQDLFRASWQAFPDSSPRASLTASYEAKKKDLVDD